MKTFIAGFLFIVLIPKEYLICQPWVEHGKLMVSDVNRHYLQYTDGTPFFWLGDTGWDMIRKLSREEIAFYLENRKNKGFNVIQTVILSEFSEMKSPVNYYKDRALEGNDPGKPILSPGNSPDDDFQYDFWDHVDYTIKTAERSGLYIALLPSWGEWVIPRMGKAYFNTYEDTYKYGRFLGERYRNAPNIIWILGGDRQPDERENGVYLWQGMAEGIADGVNGVNQMDWKADYSTTLMSHHSYNSSSSWFHGDDWIDFHTWGSYHAEINNTRSIELALADWLLPDPIPTINSEPCYEDHLINYAIQDNGFFTSTDVRQAAYWSVFSGSAGFTYGAHPVWQFADSTREAVSYPMKSWQNALELPGAAQIQYLKQLMLSRPLTGLQPDASVISGNKGSCGSSICALRGISYLYVYIPTGLTVEILMGNIKGQKVTASWFDPRTGIIIPIGTFPNSGIAEFSVPGMSDELGWLRSGRGCDWVLIIEDSALSIHSENLLK